MSVCMVLLYRVASICPGKVYYFWVWVPPPFQEKNPPEQKNRLLNSTSPKVHLKASRSVAASNLYFNIPSLRVLARPSGKRRLTCNHKKFLGRQLQSVPTYQL